MIVDCDRIRGLLAADSGDLKGEQFKLVSTVSAE